MKLNKKSIFALLLALCLVFTCIPAFAATVEVEREGVDIPAEGVALNLSRGGMQNNAIRFIFEYLSDDVQRAVYDNGVEVTINMKDGTAEITGLDAEPICVSSADYGL